MLGGQPKRRERERRRLYEDSMHALALRNDWTHRIGTLAGP